MFQPIRSEHYYVSTNQKRVFSPVLVAGLVGIGQVSSIRGADRSHLVCVRPVLAETGQCVGEGGPRVIIDTTGVDPVMRCLQIQRLERLRGRVCSVLSRDCETGERWRMTGVGESLG